jgi:hypothetical protein
LRNFRAGLRQDVGDQISYTEQSKVRAVVAVMRKLLRAAFYVARGSAFDASKLFDVRRLASRSPKTTTVATSVEAPAETSAAATTVAAVHVVETTGVTTNLSKETRTMRAAPIDPVGSIDVARAEGERPAARRAVRKQPARVIAKNVEAPAEQSAITTNVVATHVAATTPATTSVAKETRAMRAAPVDPLGPNDAASAARERPAAERVKQDERASSPSVDASCSRAPVSLQEMASAARNVAAACRGGMNASSSTVVPRATREPRRARTLARAST